MDSDNTEASSGAGAERTCPWCGSASTRFVSRGYTGPTDETDQYFTCAGCGRTTFELVAKSAREMRLGRYKPGEIYQDRANRTRYQISRVLRVGANEFLVYLKPLAVDEASGLLSRRDSGLAT